MIRRGVPGTHSFSLAGMLRQKPAPFSDGRSRFFMSGSWIHRRSTVLASLLVILALSKVCNSHSAIQPIAVLQEGIGKVLRILEDPHYKRPAMRSAQKARLAEIADRLFDFREFSKLTLGPFWPRFTRTEQLEFVDAFTAFLKDAYIGIAQDLYTDEQVILLGQRLAERVKAQVNAKVVWKGVEVPIEFRLLQRGTTWKVYDVVFLGISGVRIYRAQFKAFLDTGSPADLIKRIKEMRG
jgi:phospholipid transport system substrate-binding protein